MDDMSHIIELEQNHVLQTYARAPFVLDHGKGCWVYDTAGNGYLDCAAGIAVNALGHAHPSLVAALTEQAGKLWHVSNLYHTAPQAQLAETLCASSFAERVFFCNSGAACDRRVFQCIPWPHVRRVGRHPA